MALMLQTCQKTNISMTFELRQAIELLQYSVYELKQFIHEQELENPLIELEEKEENLYEGEFTRSSNYDGFSSTAVDAFQKTQENVRDELFKSVKLTCTDPYDRKLLRFLIYNLDNNGYLPSFYADLESCSEFDEQEIQKGIHLLQKFGPAGIGARNLKECLLLQIQHKHPNNNLAADLIENHLNLIADHKWKEIALLMNISIEKVKILYDFIQTLHPKPCSFESDLPIEYVTPDIIVKIKNNKLTFSLNDHFLPDIHLNTDYLPYSHAKNEVSKYINRYYQKYQWLLNSIEQRRKTLTKIMEFLLKRQSCFFKKGSLYVQPLTLKEVAEEIGVHESTVSRATMNKIIQTPFGSFDMRVLFTSKLITSDGTSISQTKVKTMMQEFIAKENKLKPLSDQKIAEYFTVEQGIPISRRTVNKYREELNIPPSSRRKAIRVM